VELCVCDAATRRLLCVKDDFHVRECGSNRDGFTEWQPAVDHVSVVYGDSYCFEGGAGFPDYLSEVDPVLLEPPAGIEPATC